MRYLVAGDSKSAPPLLLIHGLLGYSFSWRNNLSALAENRRVYAIDLPGVGFSERVPGLDCSLSAMAERLLCFLREQGIASVDIVGTSHGGGLAMVLSAMARERAIGIRKLVLVAAVNPWSRHGIAITSFLGTKIGAGLFRSIQLFAGFSHRIALTRMYGDRRRISPGTLQGYSAPLKIKGTMDHVLKIAACWQSDLDTIKDTLPRIADLPTLLVWGDRDRAVLPSSAPQLQAQFKNAELRVIKTAGHLPYEEMPEEFNRVLIEFLEK